MLRDEYMYDRNDLDELRSIQDNLADYLVGLAVGYNPIVAPMWSENEEGVWEKNGSYTAFDPDVWESYIDGVAVEY